MYLSIYLINLKTMSLIYLYFYQMHSLCSSGSVLSLASKADRVSDIKDIEHMFHHVFEEGGHAQLFYVNDFKIIEDFVRGYKS